MLPNGTKMICKTMDDLGTTEILKNLISKMVAEEPENRFQELAPVIDIVEDLIGDNKPNECHLPQACPCRRYLPYPMPAGFPWAHPRDCKGRGSLRAERFSQILI